MNVHLEEGGEGGGGGGDGDGDGDGGGGGGVGISESANANCATRVPSPRIHAPKIPLCAMPLFAEQPSENSTTI